MVTLGNSRPRFIFQNSEHTMHRRILRRSFGNQGIHFKFNNQNGIYQKR